MVKDSAGRVQSKMSLSDVFRDNMNSEVSHIQARTTKGYQLKSEMVIAVPDKIASH